MSFDNAHYLRLLDMYAHLFEDADMPPLEPPREVIDLTREVPLEPPREVIDLTAEEELRRSSRKRRHAEIGPFLRSDEWIDLRTRQLRRKEVLP